MKQVFKTSSISGIGYQNLTLKFLLGILVEKSESNDSLIQFVECLDLRKCERTVNFLVSCQ